MSADRQPTHPASERGSEINDPLKPSVALLVKLGSIVIHADEMLSPMSHAYDVVAMRTLLEDNELNDWLAAMDKMAFLPKKRQL